MFTQKLENRQQDWNEIHLIEHSSAEHLPISYWKLGREGLHQFSTCKQEIILLALKYSKNRLKIISKIRNENNKGLE